MEAYLAARPVRSVLGLTLSFLLFAGCAQEGVVAPEFPPGESIAAAGPDASAWGRSGSAVTLPFKARFYTDLAGLAPDPNCGDPGQGIFLNTQVGEGTAAHLGRFLTRITFCVDATDLLDDGTLTEGESLPYWDGMGTLTAADGDELWITVAGAVLPSGHPDYDFEFADPFEIIGGTGRFEGAGGHGVTDSFVDSAANRTDHRWLGELILHPGS